MNLDLNYYSNACQLKIIPLKHVLNKFNLVDKQEPLK